MTSPSRPSSLARDLLRVDPAPGAHRVAARAALCILLALLVLWAAGRPAWALYATFGTFTSVYGGRVPRPGRWRVQTGTGLLFTAVVGSAALVALSDDRSVLVVPVAAGWAAVTGFLAARGQWRPPGPMFFVFAAAACGSVPVVGADAVAVVAVTAGAALLAVTLGGVEELLARRGNHPAPPAPAPTRPSLLLSAVLPAAVVVAAGSLALVAGIGHPYWAMVAAVVPLVGVGRSAQFVRALQRTVGTLLGVLVAAALLWLELPVLAVCLVVAVLQGLTELVVTRNYGFAMVLITPLALLSGQLAVARPVGTLVVDRLVETVLGVVVGLLGAELLRLHRRGRPAPAG